jgi:small subunit ribosomal protein S9
VPVTVAGSELSGQVEAVRHGVVQAMDSFHSEFHRRALKRLGFATRDPRKAEPNKAGLKKARKVP